MNRIVIIGAGPAASVAGLVLARAGFEPLLVDPLRHPLRHLLRQQRQGERKIGESLVPAAKRLLAHLGLADLLASHLPCPGSYSSWGSYELEPRDFIWDPDG